MTTTVAPAVPGRFDDIARLFGPNGACSGCWCMWPRLTGREFDARHGAGTRRMLESLVDDGREPGLLAHADGEPVGWVSVAPRPDYGRMLRSPLLRPHLADTGRDSADDPGVWSVVCFFVGRDHRGGGLLDTLAAAAVARATEQGAHTVEGYPIDPRPDAHPDEVFHGTPGVFARAGFSEVARLSPRRTLWRLASGRAAVRG